MQVSTELLFDGNSFCQSRILEWDSTGRILDLREAEKIDYALAMPGMIDSHVHLLGTGLALNELNLRSCSSEADFMSAVRRYAAENSSSWLRGRGWDQNKMGFTPDRKLLDELCPQRPLVLYRVCGHVLAANSAALQEAGISAITDPIAGGTICLGCDGEPSGILEEKALLLFDDIIPLPEDEVICRALISAISRAYEWGLTGVQTDDLSLVGSFSRLWELYCRVTDSYPFRVQLHHRVRHLKDLQAYAQIISQNPQAKWVEPGAGKLFLDGSLGARTAALTEPYCDSPQDIGVLVYTDEELEAMVAFAEAENLSLALHAIGDRAIQQAISSLSKVRGALIPGKVRHRLIHCQVTSVEQIQQLKRLGFVIEIQPGFLGTDMHWAPARLGSERLQTSYCWRTMLENGLVLAGGSDAPVESMNPWLGVDAAVTRLDLEGRKAMGWNRDESLTREEALALYTSRSGSLMARQQGMIGLGKVADLCLYKEFYLDNLAANRPDLVIVGGRTVFKR